LSISLANTSQQAAASQPVETDSNKQNTTADSQGSQNRASTSTPAGRRKRRSTEVSISGLDSGTESDFPKPTEKKLKLEGEVTGDGAKKKKRKRQKRKTPHTAFSLTKFLSKLQVFP
jgi:hypothetical protein